MSVDVTNELQDLARIYHHKLGELQEAQDEILPCLVAAMSNFIEVYQARECIERKFDELADKLVESDQEEDYDE